MGAAAPANWGMVAMAGAAGGGIGCLWTCGDACVNGESACCVVAAAFCGTTTGTLGGAMLGGLTECLMNLKGNQGESKKI